MKIIGWAGTGVAFMFCASLGCEPMLHTGSSREGAHATSEIVTDGPTYIPLNPGVNPPAVATDGRIFFSAWRDWRNDTTGNSENIYGARVLGSGRVLEPTGLLIATGMASYLNQDPIDAAFDGSNFVVAWGDIDVHVARVTPSGQVLDPGSRTLNVIPANYAARWVSVACGGTNCLVVWVGGLTSIGAARIDASLSILDSTPIHLTSVNPAQPIDKVAFDGVNYVVVWEDWSASYNDSRIVSVRVRPSDGVVLDSSPVALSSTTGGAHDPHIACEGQERCLVSWGGAPGFARLSQGAPTAARSTTIAGAVAWDGSSYRSAWTLGPAEDESILTARLDANGAFAPTSTVVGHQCVARGAALAATGTITFATWEGVQYCGAGFNALGARISSSGPVMDASPIPLSARANGQAAPTAAFDGTNYLWVWADERGTPGATGNGALYATRVSPDGQVLDAAPLMIAPYGLEPQVVFDGSNFLVVWREEAAYGLGTFAFGTRVSSAGMLLDSHPLPLYVGRSICTSIDHNVYASVTAACAPSGCMVLSTYECQARFAPMTRRSEAKLIHVDPLTLAVSTSTLTTLDAPVYGGTIDFDGMSYLAAWTDGHNIVGGRASESGVVLDRLPITIVSSTHAQASPRLHSNGRDEILVWQRGGAVWFTRLSSTASSLDGSGRPVARTSTVEAWPSVTNDGTAFWIVWNDDRSALTGSDFFGVSLDPASTTTTSTSPLLLVQRPFGGGGPVIAHGPPGQALLTYGRFHAEAPFGGTPRVQARIISLTGAVPEPDASVDASFADAAIPDVAQADGSASDALSLADATIDAGEDAAEQAAEAGSGLDAGATIDARTATDGSSGHAASSGCSCRATDPGQNTASRWTLSVAFALALLFARRKDASG
jgi:hypothetical protein